MTNRNLLIAAFTLFTLFLLNLNANAAPVKPIKIAVIDTGYTFIPWDNSGFKLCETGHFDYNESKPQVGADTMSHGSFVLSIINRRMNTKNACFLVYKVFGEKVTAGDIDNAMIKAYRNGANVINLSLTMRQYSRRTRNIIKTLTRKGVKIFAAAGNSANNVNLKCIRYPVCYKGLNANFVRVGALDEDDDVAKYSNYGTSIALYKYGRTMFGDRGTSFAAPRAAGDFVKSLNHDRRR